MTNCVRHANSKTITVTVAADDATLRVSIVDDGVGMDVTRRRDGLGLRGMEERVRELGGTVAVVSARGRGTRVAISLPVPATTPEVTLARAAG
jgi:signal transduction histidine kinase